MLPQVVGTSEVEIEGTIGPDNGPRVLEMSIDTARGLRREKGDFLVAPIKTYRPAIRPFASARSKGLFDSVKKPNVVKVSVKNEKGEPIKGAVCVVILNEFTKKGFRRTTGSSGNMSWKFPGEARADRVYIYPPPGYWGRFEENVGFNDTLSLIHI